MTTNEAAMWHVFRAVGRYDLADILEGGEHVLHCDRCGFLGPVSAMPRADDPVAAAAELEVEHLLEVGCYGRVYPAGS